MLNDLKMRNSQPGGPARRQGIISRAASCASLAICAEWSTFVIAVGRLKTVRRRD
jgi:hypothetical protein